MFFERLSQDPQFNVLAELWSANGSRINVTGLPDEAKSFLLAALLEKKQQPVVLLVADELVARRWVDDLSFWKPELNAQIFSAREIQIADATAIERESERRRLRVLTELLASKLDVLIVPAPALLQILPPPEQLAKQARLYRVGDELDPQTLREMLADCDYQYAARADATGEYAARGDIVDFVPAQTSGEHGIRVSFFDTEIDQIRSYDLESQRGEEVLESFHISPLREVILCEADRMTLANQVLALGREASQRVIRQAGTKTQAIAAEEMYLKDADRLKENLSFPAIDRYLRLIFPESHSILDYANYHDRNPFVIVDEPGHVWQRMDQAAADMEFRTKELWERQAAPLEALESWLNPGKVRRDIDTWPKLMGIASLLTDRQGLSQAELIKLFVREADSYRGHEGRFLEDVRKKVDEGGAVILMAASDERVSRLRESFPAHESQPDHLRIIQGQVTGGFDYPKAGLIVFTGKEIFGAERRRSRRKKERPGEAIDFFTDLTPGDYIVHDTHGIGIYRGLETLKMSGGKRDYLKVEYAKEDSLYVPIDSLQEIRKFVGAGSTQAPRLSRLGGGDWERLKSRAKDAIKKLATDLVKLYAERQAIKGYAFSKATPWEQDFAANFEFEETEDQLRCITEVNEDMESPKVMDRLLCGDVGFGKTEVAFRAMFKAVGDGKQAALLTPTTVLAQQHYQNFIERSKDFPIEVRLLSRFVSPKAQRETLRDLASGRVDVVIGTHRLLSKEVRFKDLGLLVVDEEQRFGVDHKEMIKDRYPAVDVLTLTATPIPRTLHMSLTGIRDISLINDPPEDRRPVRTYVMEMDPTLIEEAIRREVDRRGQVFYLYNNTRTIREEAEKLRRRIPGLRVLVAHGQMPENQLEEVMHDFLEGEADVLLCTTIIESGIDMPRVNTLIVTNADRLGLAQLYQLKGRVGRSSRQAYAYFTFEKDKLLSEVAEKRLTTLREFTELGSGMKIALRDLEVRGAGNLLGGEQHGQMEAVGYDLYTRMLEEEVNRAKAELEPKLPALEELSVRHVGHAKDAAEAAAAAREQAERTRRHHPGATIELSIDAWFPSSYIPDEGGRMDLYRRISEIRTNDDYVEIYDELLDRFGEPGERQVALLDIAYIKAQAENLGLLSISSHRQGIKLDFGDGDYLNPAAMGLLLTLPDWQPYFHLHAGKKPHILIRNAGTTALEQLKTLRKIFRELEVEVAEAAAA